MKGGASPPGIFFPTVPIGDEYPSGLMEGVLEVRSGCVFISAHGDLWLLLWPAGYSARLVGSGGRRLPQRDRQLGTAIDRRQSSRA